MNKEIDLLNKLISGKEINLYDYEYIMHEYKDGYNTLYDSGGNEVDFDDEDCKFKEDNFSENEDTIEERCSISASNYSFKINEE